MHSSLPLLVIPGIVVLLSILAAALLLRGRKKTPVRKSIEVQRLGEPEAQGNIYVSDVRFPINFGLIQLCLVHESSDFDHFAYVSF